MPYWKVSSRSLLGGTLLEITVQQSRSRLSGRVPANPRTNLLVQTGRCEIKADVQNKPLGKSIYSDRSVRNKSRRANQTPSPCEIKTDVQNKPLNTSNYSDRSARNKSRRTNRTPSPQASKLQGETRGSPCQKERRHKALPTTLPPRLLNFEYRGTGCELADRIVHRPFFRTYRSPLSGSLPPRKVAVVPDIGLATCRGTLPASCTCQRFPIDPVVPCRPLSSSLSSPRILRVVPVVLVFKNLI